jgi:hypothetical protein
VAWIHTHTWLILLGIAALSAAVFQVLLARGVNILKPIVLIGTFALALAFAANDLVNFIGVPLAGLHSYQAAVATSNPLGATMESLAGKIRSESYFLLIAGVVMVLTLWLSRKARTVTATTVDLSRQEEGVERFEASPLSRAIVRMILSLFDSIARITPAPFRRAVNRRMNPDIYHTTDEKDHRPSFDLLRAAVNLMMASAVVSYATSQKLPLSTTYVTFMVAMGTSFADRAWGRESAVYRVTGVLPVIGGWFMTALMAFTFAGLAAVLIFKTNAFGVIGLIIAALLIILKTHRTHSARERAKQEQAIFNLKKVKDPVRSVSITFEHVSYLLRELRESLDRALDALFAQDEVRLRAERKKTKKMQIWVNIIIANIFKTMRLLQKGHADVSPQYPQTIRRLQKLIDGHRDIVKRSLEHVGNHHKGLLDEQVEELREIGRLLSATLLDVETTINQGQASNYRAAVERDRELRNLAESFNHRQSQRIQDDISKTRLSILYYAIVGNAMMISKQNLKILEIFEESFGGVKSHVAFDLD